MQQSQNQLLSCLEVTIAPGITNAVYFGSTAAEGNKIVKYLAGGTLYALNPSSTGSTVSPALLVTGYSNLQRYLFSSTEVVTCGGPASFYLACLGATTTVGVLRGITPQAGL